MGIEFNDTITLLNKLKLNGKTTYKETIISGCLIAKEYGSSKNKEGYVANDLINVYIPYKADFGGKSFIDDIAFSNLSSAEADKYYTFAKGDYVLKGSQSLGGITINDYKNMTRNIFEIVEFNDNRLGGLQHFVLVCK